MKKELVRLAGPSTGPIQHANSGGEPLVVVRHGELVHLEVSYGALIRHEINQTDAERLRDLLDGLRDEVEKRHKEGLVALEKMGLKPTASASDNPVSEACQRYATAINATLDILKIFYGVRSRRSQ